MKRSEKLLDAIGQIDDKLVADAAKAGQASGGRKKNKAKIYRWQSALAACAALVICVGVISLLNRNGLLLGPAGTDSSGKEEMAMDAQDAVSGSADSSVGSAEAASAVAADSASTTSQQSSSFDMAEAATEEGKAAPELGEAEQNVQSAEIVADDLAGTGADSGISAQSSDREAEQSLQQQKEAGSAESADVTAEAQEESCSLPPAVESVKQAGQSAGMSGQAALTVKESGEKGVTVLIENSGEREILFGEAFELEQLVGESWQTVIPDQAVNWKAVDILVGAGDTYEETIVLDSYYGKLQPGQYRIVKTYQLAAGKEPQGQETYLMYGEFTIGQ